jgi:flagellar hook protein FlgE
MQSSLYTGVSGLNANMSKLSVIGNNIANSNTVGFKGSRVVFDDVLSQTLSGGSGTNQIGLGVKMSSIQKMFSQGPSRPRATRWTWP